MTEQTSLPKWHSFLKQHIALHPFAAAALVVSTLIIILLLSQSFFNTVDADTQYLKWALMAGTAGFLATAIGALPALLLRQLPQKFEDSMLGFAAGMMLAASTFSLIMPTDTGEAICDKCTDERKDQRIIGMTIVKGIKKNGAQYDGGEILDPEEGKVYKCKMTLNEVGDELEVRGYIGFSLLGRSQIWTRVE